MLYLATPRPPYQQLRPPAQQRSGVPSRSLNSKYPPISTLTAAGLHCMEIVTLHPGDPTIRNIRVHRVWVDNIFRHLFYHYCQSLFWSQARNNETMTAVYSAFSRARNEPLPKFSQSRRRPLLGPCLVWKQLSIDFEICLSLMIFVSMSHIHIYLLCLVRKGPILVRGFSVIVETSAKVRRISAQAQSEDSCVSWKWESGDPEL